MKYQKSTIKNSAFFNALNSAKKIGYGEFKETKLGYWCRQFLTLNKDTIRLYNKNQKLSLGDLPSQLENIKIDNAIEKDGIVLRSDIPGPNGTMEVKYEFSKEGLKKVEEDGRLIIDQISSRTEEFMSKDICVNTFVSEDFNLPKNIHIEDYDNLNGIIFNHKSEFFEDMEEIEKNSKKAKENDPRKV